MEIVFLQFIINNEANIAIGARWHEDLTIKAVVKGKMLIFLFFRCGDKNSKILSLVTHNVMY